MTSPWWMPSIRGSAVRATPWCFDCPMTSQASSFRRISAGNRTMRHLPFSFLRRKPSLTSREAPKATTSRPHRGPTNPTWQGMWTATFSPLTMKAFRSCQPRPISVQTITTNRISYSSTPITARTSAAKPWAATWPSWARCTMPTPTAAPSLCG